MDPQICVLIILNIIQACHCSYTGARLGDFPPPDFTKTITLSNQGYASFAEVSHNFGKVPFHVRVYAFSKDSDNSGFVFEGVGACQNDGTGSGSFGGVLFAYNKISIRLWAPTDDGKVIFVGEGWGGNTHSQSSTSAEVQIEAWKDGPSASFEKEIQIHTKRKFKIELGHPLLQLPELISIRVTASNKKEGDFYFNAVGASQTSSESRTYGGIVFAYNDNKIVFWAPNKIKTGCIHIGKRWGNGKFAHRSIQNCTIHIRLWVGAFSAPVFQTKWQTFYANQHKKSYVEISHHAKIFPSYVKVQYRIPGMAHALVFEATGSVQTTSASENKYGGVLYAYTMDKIRLWLPTSSKLEQASIIYVGNGWGIKNESISSTSAEIRIQLYSDRCFESKKLVDAQGHCRDGNDTYITPEMTSWSKCSNPCGKGSKSRAVKDCVGRSLQTVIDCQFQNGMCGFKSHGFPWFVSMGVPVQKASHLLQIPSQGPKKQSYFIYSNTSEAKEGDRGSLISKNLVREKGCVLRFKYSTESYFGLLRIDAIKPNGKLKEDIWHMTDTQVMKSAWRTGYVNIGWKIGDIKEIHFVHQLNNDCPDNCHPVSIADVVLECERSDHYVIPSAQCDKKAATHSSCLINVFQPHSRGPAWSIQRANNSKNTDIGQFVTADGRTGDLIAGYEFVVAQTGVYQLWLDSFALSSVMNGVTIQIGGGKKYSHDLIYNRQDSLWLPFSMKFYVQAGTFYLKLYQMEKHFRYKNLMMAPVHIDVWSALGMQSRFIPDSAFQSLGGQSAHLAYSRLNGLGAWMPTDNNIGKFFLEIRLPEVALINRIATQGGMWLDTAQRWYCHTDSYKIKFSLDGHSFAYYRNNTLKDIYLFPGNSKILDEIVEHTFAYVVVARSVRFYPVAFLTSGCLRVELYGFYMSQSMCPKVESKIREEYCNGNGDCGYANAECELNEATNTSECTCVKNYHGDRCKLAGCNPDPCRNNATCDGDDISFTCLCKSGFKGRYCNIPCSAGTYGINCLNKCNCPGMEYCNPIDGTCSCLPGFFGPYCKKPCNNRTYGKDCKMVCSCSKYMECDHISGICQCPAGFYGDKCQQRCLNETFGKDCREKCSCVHYGICNGTDGSCDCPPGWRGTTCNEPCGPDRYGKYCSHICQNPKNSRCDPVTGHTTCNPGFKGPHCQYPCSDRKYGEDCELDCSCYEANTETCDAKTGKCMCKPGYMGERCEKKCKNTWGPQCKNKCTCENEATCDIQTGVCTCTPGFIGPSCKSLCTSDYYGPGCTKKCNCSEKNTMKCQPQDGFCRCKPGYQGAQCEDICQRNYWGRNCFESCKCLQNAPCDHRDGYCYCPKGFQGQFCGSQCDEGMYGEHCASVCQCKNDAHCDSIDGHCECDAGYQGIFCESICPTDRYGLHCAKKCACNVNHRSDCNHVNGSCTCLPGYQGKLCEKECDDGFYGQDCASNCSCYHTIKPCHKNNGTCHCTPGFTGRHCINDCDWLHYGNQCIDQCHCDKDELCNNINGECFLKSPYTFKINLLVDVQIFTILDAKHYLKTNFERIMYQCFNKFTVLVNKYPTKNISKFGNCVVDAPSDILSYPDGNQDPDLFVTRIVSIETMYTDDDTVVSSITLNLMHSSNPVNGTLVTHLLKFVGHDTLSKVLKHPYYTGVLYASKQSNPWHHGSLKYVVIGVAVFGGLLLLCLAGLLIRCTVKVRNPSPFKKIKRTLKEIEMPMLPNNNSHMLAFENPYYDVIAAMGLDDDIEEDYYNPLYDNLLELQSDSEAETDDMYYFRNNQYRGNHYPYDKDSGFSSGTLI